MRTVWPNKVVILIKFCFYYSKAYSHDKEVQRLYEEMEQQIRAEKERIHNEVSWVIMDFFTLKCNDPTCNMHLMI